MFLTKELWARYLQLRNHHMFLYGQDISLIDEFIEDATLGQTTPIQYHIKQDERVRLPKPIFTPAMKRFC